VATSVASQTITGSADGPSAYKHAATIATNADAIFTVKFASSTLNDDGDRVGIYAVDSSDDSTVFAAFFQLDNTGTDLIIRYANPDAITNIAGGAGAQVFSGVADPVGKFLRAIVSKNGADQDIRFEYSADGASWTEMHTFTVSGAWSVDEFGLYVFDATGNTNGGVTLAWDNTGSSLQTNFVQSVSLSADQSFVLFCFCFFFFANSNLFFKSHIRPRHSRSHCTHNRRSFLRCFHHNHWFWCHRHCPFNCHRSRFRH
jgi:hypothetical protein